MDPEPNPASQSSLWRRAAAFLGLRRSLVGLLGMVVLIGIGERLAERFLPLYLLAVGGGSLVVGLLAALDNLRSALYSIPGGYLSHRLGHKRSLILFNLLAMAGFLIAILIPTWPAAIVGSFLFLSWTAISLPTAMSLVADALPRTKRTMGVSMHSLVRRIPMAVGPIIGGLCLDRWGTRDGMRVAFAAALGLAAVALALQQLLIEPDRPSTGTGNAEGRSPMLRTVLQAVTGMSPPLRALLTSDVLMRFCEQIPYAFVVIWCTQTIRNPVTAFQFGLLTAIEMATALVIYIPVAYLADKANKKPFVLLTFVFFTLFPAALLLSRSLTPLIAVFVLRGLKEFGEATRKALILDLAPEDAKALTFGAYYFVRDSIVSLAAYGGALLWMIAPAWNLLTASVCGALGTAWFAWRGRDATPSPGR